jgi:hypothetical protein
MALTRFHNYQVILDQVFQDVALPDFESIAIALLDNVLGMGFESEELSGRCIMIRKKLVLQCGGFDAETLDDAIVNFGRKLLDRKQTIIQAVDVFCY